MSQSGSADGHNILFRGRRDHQLFNVDYVLWDGHQPGDLSSYLVGDSVDIWFLSKRELVTKLTHYRPAEMEEMGFVDALAIPCTVVKRKHGLMWKCAGKFDQCSSVSVTLEAETDFWEEVLKLVLNREEPDWMQ